MPALPERQRFTASEDRRVYRVVRTVGGTANGRRIFRSGVGVSDLSEAQADVEARAQAQRAVEDAVAGRGRAVAGYAYHADKRLEPVIEVIRTANGDAGRVTVNSYGSLVLNATSAMFVDVDTGDDVDEPRGAEVPDDLRDLVERRTDLGFRAYRTRAGWRYLCTTLAFDPASAEVQTLLDELGSDEKYILLCKLQRTFRARLTPKPWRAKQRPLDVGADGVDRDMLVRLIDRTWRFATARYITSVGSAVIAPDVQPIVDAHDRWTQAFVRKPLA